MLVPAGVVTIISTNPAARAGDVAVICVAEFTTKEAAVPPNVTEEVLVKFVPVITTDVPPVVGPVLGETPVTVGGLATVLHISIVV